MEREHKLLKFTDASRLGLEIGPSHRPVAPKRAGYNVKILDHATSTGLRDKYKDHGVDLNSIEEVDYVWSGESFIDLIGKDRFGWIIASHVIEHTPDLIGFINDCDKILDQGGVLSLAVPDKRYCFDHFREKSSLSKVIDAHELGMTIHSVGTAAEYFLNVTRKGDLIAWDSESFDGYSLVHGLDDAKRAIEQTKAGAYLDLHAWCFPPSSFRLLIEDLNSLGYIKLKEVAYFDTVGHEFFVTLGQDGNGSGLTREQLLARKEKEI